MKPHHIILGSCLAGTCAAASFDVKQEWLEVMPSNRLMWGADALHPEGTCAVTAVTRRCLAEALAEKVERGELREDDALRIGRQVLRDNALELYPRLKDRLWQHKGKLEPPTK